jgi:hypothetical protein
MCRSGPRCQERASRWAKEPCLDDGLRQSQGLTGVGMDCAGSPEPAGLAGRADAASARAVVGTVAEQSMGQSGLVRIRVTSGSLVTGVAAAEVMDSVSMPLDWT